MFPFLSLNKKHHFKYFKGCLPQIPLGLFLNTLSHIKMILWEFGKTFSSHAPLKFAFLCFTFYVWKQIFCISKVSISQKVKGFKIQNLFGTRKLAPKKLKKKFFQDFLKVYAHYFTVFIYCATWRAAKLGVFCSFKFTKLPRCSHSINWLKYVYSIQIPSCFL